MAFLDRVLIIMGCLVASSHLLQGLVLLPTKNSNHCGDWINYDKEKCLKIMDNVSPQTKEVGEMICRSLLAEEKDKPIPRLVTIKNKQQQTFLHNLVSDSKMASNVWLGLTQNNTTGQLEWNDGSKVVFSNLAKVNISESNSTQCVEMNINEKGLWLPVSCTNQNRIVCERDATWPLENMEGFQQDSNQSSPDWQDIKSEKECKEEIMKSERKTDVLKDAAEKAMEGVKYAVEGLNVAVDELADATKKIEDPETRESAVKQINHFPGGSSSSLKDTSLCGDGWTPYKDEKCLKIVDTLKEWEDAARTCRKINGESSSGSSLGLMTIKTGEEQEFLRSFLFAKNKLVDNVWLGLKKKEKDGDFGWNDGSEVTFNNWANQTAANDDVNQCAEITPGGGLAASGLWLRVNCKKKNLVVCEKRPTWAMETLQNAFLNYKLEQKMKEKESEKKQEEKVQDMKKRIDVLEQNPVPIGFIYVELSGQAPPSTLWPSTNWTDVSSSYSGLFFRVVGGQADPFGQIQEASTTRLEGVEPRDGADRQVEVILPPEGSWSKTVRSGYGDGRPMSLRFRLSTSEIRPRNQAVRIWKRIS